MPASNHWEQGSEFHWLDFEPTAPKPAPWGRDGALYGSGQDALRALLLHGKAVCHWRRLWAPSYFCQQVIEAFISTGLEVQVYPAAPDDNESTIEPIEFRNDDVLLVINFFGLDTRPALTSALRAGVVVIEDHTHDPWSDWAWHSKADWCVASLRKTLPMPDGGMLWSPRGHALPQVPPVTAERNLASLEKIAAMALKARYLAGHAIDKDIFRRLAIAGEQGIVFNGNLPAISGISEWSANLLVTFPLAPWRHKRQANHRHLSGRLEAVDWLRVLQPRSGKDSSPFSCIALFDTPERRNAVRQSLIAARVYPAVLWSLEEPVIANIPTAHLDFSRRMLSIHCDMRYSLADMDRVADIIIRCRDA